MNIPQRFKAIKQKSRYEYIANGSTIKIPSNLFPLNDIPETFFKENTKLIVDKKVLDLIDSIEYKVGRCYTNADNITNSLMNNGYNAHTYVGWYINPNAIPMHHAWVVLQDKHIIDISDEFDCFFYNIQELKIEWNKLSKDEQRKLLVDFRKLAKEHKNSERCHLGIASSSILYIGSKCTGNKGKMIFDKLLASSNQHPSLMKNTDTSGKTKVQKMMEKKGLL